MSRTTSLIEQYLSETRNTSTTREYYGDHMKLKHLHKKHEVVCTDMHCNKFKDTQQVQPGDIVYLEDENGDLTAYKIT
jgi:hypothetical protein